MGIAPADDDIVGVVCPEGGGSMEEIWMLSVGDRLVESGAMAGSILLPAIRTVFSSAEAVEGVEGDLEGSFFDERTDGGEGSITMIFWLSTWWIDVFLRKTKANLESEYKTDTMGM